MKNRVDRLRTIRKQARVWMLVNDIRGVDIQKALHLRSYSLVANTLGGRQSNRRVLQYLKDQGCPAEYLDLPADTKERKVNRKKKLNKKERL